MTQTVKIYRIRIIREGLPFKMWYYNHRGEMFYSVLVNKDTTGGRTPVFALVERDGDKYKPAAVVRTVRPNHCVVVDEELTDRTHLQQYLISF